MKFITSIAEAMYRFKSYPTKEQYDHVANQVVKKWPFLETRSGHVSTGHVSTALLYAFFYVLFCLTAVALLQGYLVEALKERMAYLQKPDGQKRGKAQMNVTPSSPVQPLMPSSPVVTVQLSEDRASHERHLKCLKRDSESVRTFAPTSRYIATSTSHANLPFSADCYLRFLLLTISSGNKGVDEKDISS